VLSGSAWLYTSGTILHQITVVRTNYGYSSKVKDSAVGNEILITIFACFPNFSPISRGHPFFFSLIESLVPRLGQHILFRRYSGTQLESTRPSSFFLWFFLKFICRLASVLTLVVCTFFNNFVPSLFRTNISRLRFWPSILDLRRKMKYPPKEWKNEYSKMTDMKVKIG
jgi:hypothetical protein